MGSVTSLPGGRPDQLAGLIALNGAHSLTLDLLTHDEAHDLLIRRLGHDRVTRERADANELIDLCARLPLALNIAAAHAALHPNRPLATLVTALRDTHRRLDALSTGDATADVRAVFSWSYHTLTPTSARVFRLLGVHPGPDISHPATASLAGHDPDTTRHALDELTRAHLITEHAPGRYALHDLLRAYATDLAHTHEGDAEREEALRRIVDFYTHTAYCADHLLNPNRTPLELDPPAPGTHPEPLPDNPAAIAWLDQENTNLLAVQQTATTRAWHSAVWQLACALGDYHFRRGQRHALLTMWQAAVDAAQHLDDPTMRIRAHRSLGHAYTDLERLAEASEHLHQALALAEEIDDVTEQAHTRHQLAGVWQQVDTAQALHHATCALELYRTLDEPVREALGLNSVGWFAAQLGDYDAARASCEAALAILQRVHEPQAEAGTLDSLGYIAHHTGRHHDAIDYYQQALTVFRDIGNIYESANTLDNLGHPHLALGRPEKARAVWREALEIYRDQGRAQDADRVQRQLDALDHRGD
jgi:tetratricopeptide (TPR) repeat protein